MKKTLLLKTMILMAALSLFHTFPAVASQTPIGNLDIFNEKQITGWVYDSSDSLNSSEIQILISNSLTGDPVKMVSVKPDYQRNDLLTQVPSNATPGFSLSLDMSALPDGSYSAAAYKNGKQFSKNIYYMKGNGVGENGASIKPLGTFRLTAYCPCRSCSAGWGARTKSGAIAAENHTVAVDPKIVPLGSKLLINGTVYTAEDVGGGVKGNHVDIYHNSHQDAKQFGLQSAEVFLIQ